MKIAIWAPLGPFGTLGPYLFSYLGPLWALLGPLALIYFRILDPFGPFWDPRPLYFWNFEIFGHFSKKCSKMGPFSTNSF